tara:strand:- start:292 stop:1611 length:1320 start_codon:yes stop_codon:yes gene_type:complete
MGNFKQHSNPFSKIPKSTPLKEPGDILGPVPPTNFGDLPQFRGGNFNQQERDAEVAAAIEAGFADESGLGNRGMSEINIPRSYFTSTATRAQNDPLNINPNINQTEDGENPYFARTFTGSRPRLDYDAAKDPETGQRPTRTNSKGNELFQNADKDLQDMHNWMASTGGSVEDYAEAIGILTDGKGGFAMDPNNYNRQSGITTYVPGGTPGDYRNSSNQSFYTASNPDTGEYVGGPDSRKGYGRSSGDYNNTIMGGKGASSVNAYSPNGGMSAGYDERRALDYFLSQGADLPGANESRMIKDNPYSSNRLYSDDNRRTYNRLGGGTPLLPEEGTYGGPNPDGDGDGVPFFGPRGGYTNSMPGLGGHLQGDDRESFRFRQQNSIGKPQEVLNDLQKNKPRNEYILKTARASDSISQTIEDQLKARKIQLFKKGLSAGIKRN